MYLTAFFYYLNKGTWNWVEHTNGLKNSILGKALQYEKNQKVYLMNYLEDGGNVNSRII